MSEKLIRATIPMCPHCADEVIIGPWWLDGSYPKCRTCGEHVSPGTEHWGYYEDTKMKDEVRKVMRLMKEYLTYTVPRGHAARVGEWISRLEQALAGANGD